MPKRFRRKIDPGPIGNNYTCTDAEVWHFCRNCTRWPDSRFEEKIKRPPDERVCQECRDLDDAYDCDDGR